MPLLDHHFLMTKAISTMRWLLPRPPTIIWRIYLTLELSCILSSVSLFEFNVTLFAITLWHAFYQTERWCLIVLVWLSNMISETYISSWERCCCNLSIGDRFIYFHSNLLVHLHRFNFVVRIKYFYVLKNENYLVVWLNCLRNSVTSRLYFGAILVHFLKILRNRILFRGELLLCCFFCCVF